MELHKSERSIVYLISAVQFINILEFMIVMPLGPDFVEALGIPASQLGYIGGSYTASAAISGIGAALFIERFDRRKALACAMLGLVVATFVAALANNLTTLLCARVMAGMFGGPAASLSLAIIADSIAPERRGKAMGIVMGAFSMASVVGVPVGLELARIGGWRLPFIAVGVFGLLIAGAAVFRLPPMRAHLERPKNVKQTSLLQMLMRSPVALALSQTVFFSMSAFLLIPHVATYVQLNLGYPRANLGLLYLCGGAVSFFTMRVFGKLTDLYGAVRTGAFSTLLLIMVIYAMFVEAHAASWVMALFALFMVANSGRNIACQTQNSQVPLPDERARFMSVQSSIQHMSGAAGAFLSAKILTEGAGGELVHMDIVAYLAMIMCAVVPVFLWIIHKQLRRPPQDELKTA